jgi:hypothetical protein
MIYQEFADFWRQLPPGKTIHPADKPILDNEPHTLVTEYLPEFGKGPLATAPVVLCYLNNGYTKTSPLATVEEHGKTWGRYLAGIIEGKSQPRSLSPWVKDRVRDLNLKEGQVATFNIVPYRSQKFKNRELAQYLPSVRMARNYLHDVLLPAAARGERFVVIARAVRLWGVHPAQTRGTLAVCTPNGGGWNRGGYLPGDVKRRIKAWANT